jgi:hypothetical protein
MSALKNAAMNGVEMNRLAPDDRAVHDWYRFILSYPPHLGLGRSRQTKSRSASIVAACITSSPCRQKGGRDALSIVQIEQEFALCAGKFPGLVWRPVAAQFMDNDLIALFVFEDSAKGVAVSAEQHYRLVLPEDLSLDDLVLYRSRG